ncbi:hypothetical protein RJ639_041307 [Escallonia herrerae]|uniref:Nucleoplasmin-like domain-containing protein n=1 Tax=Escallonia herrerae TaxID=1293975 RepID=A0AA88WE47_9ASTE|nr:hypothetical protein RJ639_041307 [Escallonia herrerae]
MDFQTSFNVRESDHVVAFSRAGSDGFYFTVASNDLLLLCDVRNPLLPLLQWQHGLENPHYVTVFRFSELRSHSRDDKFKWASDMGYCILMEAHKERSLCYESSQLCAKDYGEYKLPKKYHYLKLDFLNAYLKDSLAKALHGTEQKIFEDPQKNHTFTFDFHHNCQEVKASVASLSVDDVFKDIRLPTNIREIASSRIWATLPTNLLCLAFSTYLEFLEVLGNYRSVSSGPGVPLQFLVTIRILGMGKANVLSADQELELSAIKSCREINRRVQGDIVNGSSEKKSFLQCNLGDKGPVILCVLLLDKAESCKLDLAFAEADQLVFSVFGPRAVFLTDYYLDNGKSAFKGMAQEAPKRSPHLRREIKRSKTVPMLIQKRLALMSLNQKEESIGH